MSNVVQFCWRVQGCRPESRLIELHYIHCILFVDTIKFSKTFFGLRAAVHHRGA
tara:strand:- start:1275 stop:1436 length:162 start_codon:yes stop_codon:yes gene_type:complete